MATPTKTASVTPATTDVEDIRLLANDIVALIQTDAYDDMTWAEVDAALHFVSHDIKLSWHENGSVKPVEPPETAPEGRRR
jgi:hypothetical protein